MAEERSDLLQGTLSLVILKALLAGPRHGYAIARWVEATTADVLRVDESSLYPALRRLEDRGWVNADWGTSELGRKAKVYRLTPRGRRQLSLETEEWARFAAAISRVLLPSAI